MNKLSAKEKAAYQSRRGFGKLPRTLPKNIEKLPKAKKTFQIKLHLPTITIPHHVTKKGALIASMAVVVLAGAGVLGFFAYEYQQNPEVIYAKKVQSMTEKVSKYVPLPKDEQPVTATVTDVKSLPHEAFFKDAQNGDKILLYKKHKLAVLFRPSTGQTITYATLDFKNVIPTVALQQPAVAGAATSAAVIQNSITPGPTVPYHPQGKILVAPPQQ